ncbi:MAG: hypothetical protein JXB48_10940 [Candidatus Latescibacteria bacterium]|nr:hypothetical protein [Candidatus Latescibacterota bacterium]
MHNIVLFCCFIVLIGINCSENNVSPRYKNPVVYTGDWKGKNYTKCGSRVTEKGELNIHINKKGLIDSIYALTDISIGTGTCMNYQLFSNVETIIENDSAYVYLESNLNTFSPIFIIKFVTDDSAEVLIVGSESITNGFICGDNITVGMPGPSTCSYWGVKKR